MECLSNIDASYSLLQLFLVIIKCRLRLQIVIEYSKWLSLMKKLMLWKDISADPYPVSENIVRGRVKGLLKHPLKHFTS